MKVCAVIPAYNEEKTIGDVVNQTKQYVDKVFVVDDGSIDGTAEVARQHGAEVIQHPVNIGIGAAQQTGYDAAINNDFDYIIQLDSDGQHDPKYIPEMLEIAQSCDMVIASRFKDNNNDGYPFVRKQGISFYSRLTNLLANTNITDVTSGYRVYRTECIKNIGRLPKTHWAIAQTLEAAKKGFKIKEMAVVMPVRKQGESQFSFTTYCLYPIIMIWVIIRVMLFR